MGCPGGCTYCVAGSSARDLIVLPDGHLSPQRRPTRLFGGEELLSSLASHPAFIPHRSVISIATASSEAFASNAGDETWAIMEGLAIRGLRNPVWIVTKLGISDANIALWLRRFSTLREHGVRVALSISYSGAPLWMEPHQKDRFKHCESLARTGVALSHHLRPILKGVNDSDASIQAAVTASEGKTSVICVGGLRPDTGLRFLWEHIYHLDPNLLPLGAEKDLPSHVVRVVCRALRALSSSRPMVCRSSEALSILLGIPEYNLYRYRPSCSDAFLSVPLYARGVAERRSGCFLTVWVERTATQIGLPKVEAVMRGNDVILGRVLSYQEHRALIHALGHTGFLPA